MVAAADAAATRPRCSASRAHRAVLVDIDQRVHRVERQLAPALGDAREPEQRIEVVGASACLGERRQPHDERAVGVAALLEVLAELAQDLRALVRFLGRLDAREVHVDDLVALGVERARRDPRGRALDRRAHARAIELGELLGERANERLDRAHPEGHAGAGTAHAASVTGNVRA